jgi:hypothetical protein
MKDLRPCHTGHSEANRFLSEGLKKLSLPVRICKFIDDFNPISLAIQRGGGAEEA